MEIEERRVGNVIVLDAKGKLTQGDGLTLLKDKIHSLVHQRSAQVVLNLGGVSYVDSAGIGEIVAGFTTLNRAGGSMKLLNLTNRIHDLLAITKLLTVFETFTSEDEAVRSFAATV
jgi:anti-sigma B factor antagonist